MRNTELADVTMPGITIPFFLLGSSIHPSFHPKFLIKSSDSTYTDDGEAEGGNEEPSEYSPLRPIERLLRGYRTFSDDRNAEEGEPLSLEELAEIMDSGEQEQDDMQHQGQSETLTAKQKKKLTGDGTGLERWGGSGKMSIYNEGSCITICDEDGMSKIRGTG